MKERPILFSAPMVLALLAGTKTQTRRVLKHQPYSGVHKFYFDKHPFAPSAMKGTPAEGMKLGPERHVWCAEDWCGNTIGVLGDSPYGVVGDRLWVKETWRPQRDNQCERVTYAADGAVAFEDDLPAKWSRPKAANRGNVSPLFMPRWASRLVLEITDVRIELLRGISREDAIAEGLERSPIIDAWRWSGPNGSGGATEPRDAYEKLWESINGEGSWKLNPWVWVITFKRLTEKEMSHG